jgi:23S rRNA pseudouridine2605 synthase
MSRKNIWTKTSDDVNQKIIIKKMRAGGSIDIRAARVPFSIGDVTVQKRIGLARTLSKMGHCSRSQAALLIRAGHVTVNKKIVRDPESPVRFPSDRVQVDGSPIDKQPAIYLMMNKPRGAVTTASDEQKRKTVYDLLESGLPWVGPVGRLDKASEGLLLLTNDSEWAAAVTDPARHLEKKYHVQVNCVADAGLLAKICEGCKDAILLRHGGTNSWLEITLDEGKNRQIRRLLEAVGVEVLRLVRVSIGPLGLGDLKKGSVRRLTVEEKKSIDRALA